MACALCGKGGSAENEGTQRPERNAEAESTILGPMGSIIVGKNKLCQRVSDIVRGKAVRMRISM